MVDYIIFLFSRVKMWFSILLGGIVLVLLLTVAFLTRNYGKLDNVRSLIVILNKIIWTVNVFFSLKPVLSLNCLSSFFAGVPKNLLTAVTEILPYIKIQTDNHPITIKV